MCLYKTDTFFLFIVRDGSFVEKDVGQHGFGSSVYQENGKQTGFRRTRRVSGSPRRRKRETLLCANTQHPGENAEVRAGTCSLTRYAVTVTVVPVTNPYLLQTPIPRLPEHSATDVFYAPPDLFFMFAFAGLGNVDEAHGPKSGFKTHAAGRGRGTDHERRQS